MRRSLLVTAITLGLALGSPANGQQVTKVETVSGMAPVDLAKPSDSLRIKDDFHDRMTVPLTMTGAGPFQFLVDTGANRTVVSREVATKLGLVGGPRATLHSISGTDVVHTARIRQLGLSRKIIDTIEAAVLESTHIGADGILGTDSLRSQRILFGFRKNLLTITASARRVPSDEPGTIIVQASRRKERLIVTDAIADDQRLVVVVDTGSEVTIGNAALRRALIRRGTLRLVQPTELLSVTGVVMTGELTQLRSLELGGVSLEGLSIVFADVQTFKQMKLEERPMLLLGMNALRAFDMVSIDFINKRLRLLMPPGGQRLAAR